MYVCNVWNKDCMWVGDKRAVSTAKQQETAKTKVLKYLYNITSNYICMYTDFKKIWQKQNTFKRKVRLKNF